jgi:hypothetical protein
MYSFNEIKNLLIEESNVEKVEGNDSIDLQIDRLLGEFESDSIINEDKQEVKQSKKTNLDVQQFALYISQLIDNVENLIELGIEIDFTPQRFIEDKSITETLSRAPAQIGENVNLRVIHIPKENLTSLYLNGAFVDDLLSR